MSKLLYYDLPRLNHFQKEWLKPNGYDFVRVEVDESDKFWWEVYGIKEEENGSKRLDVRQLDSR